MSARREKRIRRLERRVDALEVFARKVMSGATEDDQLRQAAASAGVMDADYTQVYIERKGLFQRLADIFRKETDEHEAVHRNEDHRRGTRRSH